MLSGGISCCELCFEDVRARQAAQEAARPKANPVITETRNGFVHQYSVFHFTCAECGRTYEARSDDIPRRYEDYEGKRYCKACWSKLERELTAACKCCGAPITLYDLHHMGRAGLCSRCWVDNMRAKREMFGDYDRMLLEFLSEHGVKAQGTTSEGLEDNGQPARYSSCEDRSHGMIRLRQSEYSVGTFRMSGGWFAIPERGSCLRYIKPSDNVSLMGFLAQQNDTILAVATRGGDVYCLSEHGTISSTDGDLDGARVFDVAERIHQIVLRYHSEEEIERKVRELSGIPCVDGGSSYYDTERHTFFRVCADGNYYHGYDVSYLVIRKEEVLSHFIRWPRLIETEEQCQEGSIPAVEVIQNLVDAYDTSYQPPDSFGYGVHFV